MFFLPHDKMHLGLSVTSTSKTTDSVYGRSEEEPGCLLAFVSALE